jgi:hypothetical protein
MNVKSIAKNRLAAEPEVMAQSEFLSTRLQRGAFPMPNVRSAPIPGVTGQSADPDAVHWAERLRQRSRAKSGRSGRQPAAQERLTTVLGSEPKVRVAVNSQFR